MRADGWSRMPIVRMTNVNLEPGAGSLEELIAGIDEGVYLETNKSWWIDDKRLNFQFGSQIAWEIKDGKLGRMLRDATYTGQTPVFWASLDASRRARRVGLGGLRTAARANRSSMPRRARRPARALPQRGGRGPQLMDALELAELAVRAAEGDEVLALVNRESSGQARFAGSEVHQPTLIENEVIELQIVRDGRLGLAASNRTDEEAVKALAARAGEAADSAPSDPSFPGFATPDEQPDSRATTRRRPRFRPEEQARLAAAAIGASSLDLYGYFTSGLTELAMASSSGIGLRQAMTDASTLALAAVDGASGYAEQTSWRVSEIDPAATASAPSRPPSGLAARTSSSPARMRRCSSPTRSRSCSSTSATTPSAPAAPGGAELRRPAGWARRLFDERFSLAEDPIDPRGLPKAFDFEGTPKHRVELVEEGVLSSVLWDRRTAFEAGNGQKSNGCAPPASAREWGPPRSRSRLPAATRSRPKSLQNA